VTTVTQTQLIAPAAISTADNVLFTVPGQTTIKIGRAVFINTSTVADTITAAITTGGAIGPGTELIAGRPIAPGESYVSPELAGAVAPAGSQIRAVHSVGSASITFTVSGLTIV
jgi:hypothetical protein